MKSKLAKKVAQQKLLLNLAQENVKVFQKTTDKQLLKIKTRARKSKGKLIFKPYEKLVRIVLLETAQTSFKHKMARTYTKLLSMQTSALKIATFSLKTKIMDKNRVIRIRMDTRKNTFCARLKRISEWSKLSIQRLKQASKATLICRRQDHLK